jgi:hypothetical protein
MILNYLLSILFLQSRIKLFSGGLKVKDIFRNWLEIFIEIYTLRNAEHLHILPPPSEGTV